ncbi:MAG: hypothetical protein AB7V56_11370 [Candidatus Nitrosocosmicus sp.]
MGRTEQKTVNFFKRHEMVPDPEFIKRRVIIKQVIETDLSDLNIFEVSLYDDKSSNEEFQLTITRFAKKVQIYKIKSTKCYFSNNNHSERERKYYDK